MQRILEEFKSRKAILNGQGGVGATVPSAAADEGAGTALLLLEPQGQLSHLGHGGKGISPLPMQPHNRYWGLFSHLPLVSATLSIDARPSLGLLLEILQLWVWVPSHGPADHRWGRCWGWANI